MSGSLSAFPEPDVGEAVVWRHASSIESQSTRLQDFAKTPPAWFRKFGKLLYMAILALFLGLTLYDGVQSGDLDIFSQAFWVSGLTKAATWGGILLLGLCLFYFLKALGAKKTETLIEPSGIPVWMSARRLVFNPSLNAPTNALDINAIQSISTDYIMGSPALSIRTRVDTFNLISSETRNLLKHLYTLRPDLEPTS